MKQNDEDVEFGIEKLFSELYKSRYIIISAIFLTGILAYSISLFLPNYYVSEAVLYPRSDGEEDVPTGGLANISSVVGIDLGAESIGKVDIALELLQSRKLLTEFIDKNQLLVDLFAVKEWDMEKQIAIYDESIYDTTQEKWVREVDFPKTVIPSDWEAYEAFLDILQVEEDATGFIRMSIESRTPELSQKWLMLLIREINDQMKRRDQENLEKSLDFLYAKVDETSNSSIREIFYGLIENQTRKMMLTESKSEYVLEILDPPIAPVVPNWPNRILILVLSMMVALVVSIFVVLVRISIIKGKVD